MFFSLFRSSEEKMKELPWHYLTSAEQLDNLIEESKSRLVIVFKHSTRCGISRMVLKDFIRNYSLTEESTVLYYLDIFSYREISNEISIRFEVVHESPQLIAIKNGNVIHHSSHYRISANKLNELVSIDA
jgi:bacillithiol system protein YtxJ